MTRKVCLVLAVVALGWGLTVATVCALDAASGRWDDPIADVPYVVAFLAAGAAFLVAGLCRYRGGWRFIAGVMLAHLGVALVVAAENASARRPRKTRQRRATYRLGAGAG